MLRLIIGKAGSGKTGAVMNEIKALAAAGKGGSLLIVPEQFSHEAERELCRRCGDSLSLYAEVMSFTGFARSMSEKYGGADAPLLDKGGRMLCMTVAADAVAGRLRLYKAARSDPELRAMLLNAADELKAACITPEMLLEAAAGDSGTVGQKMEDMALLLQAYDAVTANGHADPSDVLTRLAGQIEASDIGPGNHIYIDGFVDFTGRELEVIRRLIEKGAEVTVCLTVDSLQGDNEIFSLSRSAAFTLLAFAEAAGTVTETTVFSETEEKAPALSLFKDNMFSYAPGSFEDPSGAIRLFSAASPAAECELAAAEVLRLLRERNCRCRDISVAVRGFEDYRALLESTFERYGIPLYVSGRTSILSKPVPSLINSAYEIVSGGWDTEDFLDYLHTGLSGLDTDESDVLENYVFKWQIKGRAWKQSADWHQHPKGFMQKYSPEDEEKLARINALRRRAAAPLLRLEELAAAAVTASAHASALAEFFSVLDLPELLRRRSEALLEEGRDKAASEYRQLWEITVRALEQCAAVLGDRKMDMREFARFFRSILSQYDVGTIPVSLDSVSAGDFDRMRRRSIKHLIVLGASDARLPSPGTASGIFTEEDRRAMRGMKLNIGARDDGDTWREFTLIYNTLSLPSETLTLSYPAADGKGAAQPSMVMDRAKKMFSKQIYSADTGMLRLSAEEPAMTLAASAFSGGGPAADTSAEYFRLREPQKMERLAEAAAMDRGKLSQAAVSMLYGQNLRISPSKVDSFYACRYEYYCRYGLKAEPYEPAEFSPPEIGTFMHEVLEKTVSEVMRLGGFKAVDDETIHGLTDRFIEEYVNGTLDSCKEKSERFIYNFERLKSEAYQVVEDTAHELKRSDFQPCEFEFDFSKENIASTIDDGTGSVSISGIADRIDFWDHDGKKYIRIVDYKTGSKEFSLSDIWYGSGLQLLMYLFTLQKNGRVRLNAQEIAPAGVMYVPAKSRLSDIKNAKELADLSSKKIEELRRKGIMLNDPDLIEAWENGSDKQYIPKKTSRGKDTGETLASLEQLGILAGHVEKRLAEMADEVRQGVIGANPAVEGKGKNRCGTCDYADACHFAEGYRGEAPVMRKKLKAEDAWDNMMKEESDGQA